MPHIFESRKGLEASKKCGIGMCYYQFDDQPVQRVLQNKAHSRGIETSSIGRYVRSSISLIQKSTSIPLPHTRDVSDSSGGRISRDSELTGSGRSSRDSLQGDPATVSVEEGRPVFVVEKRHGHLEIPRRLVQELKRQERTCHDRRSRQKNLYRSDTYVDFASRPRPRPRPAGP